MYDLTIKMNTTTLANKELAKSILSINKAVEAGNKSSWAVAEEFTRIISEELFEDDFDNEKQFAEFVGITKGYLSQCKHAVDFKNAFPNIETTVSKAYLFSTIEDFEDFQNWVLEEYNAQPYEFSDKVVKDLIKEYKTKDEEPVEESVEDDIVDVDEIEEVNNIMIEVVDNDGIRYIVPLTVLNQYRVEE